MAMLARVVEALDASPMVETIAVSIDDPTVLQSDPALAALLASGTITACLDSGPSPGASVIAAAGALDDPFPLLITTADHALLDAGMIEEFCKGAELAQAQVAVGLAEQAIITAAYPDAKRTFLKFADGRYSGCNLFAFSDVQALTVAEFWSRAERFRKQPWRLAGTFGLVSLILFALGRLTLEGAFARASNKLGVRLSPIRMSRAEAAIDVDKPEDLVLVEDILG